MGRIGNLGNLVVTCPVGQGMAGGMSSNPPSHSEPFVYVLSDDAAGRHAPLIPASLSVARGIGHADPAAAGATDELARYLLVCQARSLSLHDGIWCFTLETLAGESVIEAEDADDGDLNRLSLLAAVRGLEAIDGRSIVSLISNNRYLIRSLDSALPLWRENDFVWDHFGRKIAVQNADLWRRIDRTLAIHEVTASLVQTTRISNPRARYETYQLDPPCERRTWGTTDRLRGHDAELSLADSAIELRQQLRLAATSQRPDGVAAVGHPSDRLRHWLATDQAAVLARPPRRGRYRAEDLMLT